MDYVTLAPGLPASSRLGFGCASVIGRVSRRESERAIAAALDHGITHFDVAPAYGYGEAETVLGAALKGRRDRVVIASKFGLAAPRASGGAARRVKPVAQGLVAAMPGPWGRSCARRSAPIPAPPTAFRWPQGRPPSTRALPRSRPFISISCSCTIASRATLTGDLTAYLDAQVAAGKIRAYGAATSIEAVVALEAAARRNNAVPVRQQPLGALTR